MADYSNMTDDELTKQALRGEALHQEGKAIKKAVQTERDRRSRTARIKDMTDTEKVNLYKELGQELGAKGIPSGEAVGTPGAD